MPEISISLPKFHPKQQFVFDSTASELLIAGDTRSGKSFLVRKAYIIWGSQIPGLQMDIFRLHFDDVIGENMTGETSFPNLLVNWQQAGLVKINEAEIQFWNGSAIYLEHCSDDIVLQKHQGIARHVRTFGESCQILEHRIRALTGWVTMSEEMRSRVPEKWKGQFPKVIHATNPKGTSSGYYRRNFVDCRPPLSIAKVGTFNRQYIPMFLDDNPSENKEATIARISEAFPDVATQQSLINTDKTGVSNWHTGTGEFFPEWDQNRHVVADFTPPPHWFRYRGFDWGTAEPFAVYWAAISDGEPFKDSDGNQRWFPRGAIVIYNEWYGCDPSDPAKGNRMRNEDIALGILERSEYAFRKSATLTDSLPFQDRGGETIAQVFARNGVNLTQGDTSRVPGWSALRSRLIGIQIDSNDPIKLPMIYICASCKYARDYIPALPRHPSDTKREDAAEHGEATHACDTLRLICMAHPIVRDRIEPTEERVKRALKQQLPTMKKITKRAGHVYFN